MGAARDGGSRWRSILLGLLLGGSLAGCSRDLGSITAYGPGTAAMSFELDGPTRVHFVTNLEVEAAERLEDAAGTFEYAIEARQGERIVAESHCDALQVGASFSRSRRESSTRIGSYRHSLSKAELTGCALDIPRGGPTTLRVLLSRQGSPAVHLIHLELAARR